MKLAMRILTYALIVLFVVYIILWIAVPVVEKPISIYNSGHLVTKCDGIDTETRIAQGCTLGAEYHLSPTDSWAR